MISFTVYGVPVPQGSMKAFIPKGWKRAVLTSDNPKLKAWRQQVRSEAINVMYGPPASRCIPIRLCINFHFKQAKSNKDLHKTTKPDLDKLCRAVMDALTGVMFLDDSQVVMLNATKNYADVPKAVIWVEEQP